MRDLKILLVDDEQELVEILADRLRFRGYTAEAVLNCAEAIRKIGEIDFDIAVIDVKMPEISGFETMKMIRKLKPHTKVILMTGHGTPEEGERGLAEGAFDYLVKPVNIDTLIAKIKAATGKGD